MHSFVRCRVNLLVHLVLLSGALLFSCELLAGQTANPSNPQSYRVGLKSIVIPPPTAELPEIGSDYRVLLDALAPTSNRIVAAFLLPDEAKAITGGGTNLSRYALVEVPRRAEFAEITPDIFKQVSVSVAEQFGASLDSTVKDEEDAFNRRLKELNGNASTVTIDKPFLLGTLFSKPDEVSFGAITNVSANGHSTKMVNATTIVRLQDRILFFYAYSEYANEDSVKWVREVSEKWADSALKLNQ